MYMTLMMKVVTVIMMIIMSSMMTIVLPYQVRQESHKHNSGVVITLGGLQMPATVTPSALQV